MNVSISFRPKLADILKNYSLRGFQADSVAGITVGIVVLPLAMERVNSVLNSSAADFPAGDHSRWLPEPDKTDTVGAVKRSTLDQRIPTLKSGDSTGAN